MLTIPRDDWEPRLPDRVKYIKGQQEIGEGGYQHWQILAIFERSVRLRTVKASFCNTAHAELSRSAAAEQYVWKEDTRVEGTQFEFGRKPFKRNNNDDWERIWDLAKQGSILEIDASVRIQHYRTIRAIAADFALPEAIVRTAVVYWGPTGTGKSRRAWEEGTMEAYPKDPRTKFWCGYSGQKHVIIDEFRGGIDISHLLRWLDRYPVLVEIKGSSTVLKAERIWITSNIHPSGWYPDLDPRTYEALERRLEIVEIN